MTRYFTLIRETKNYGLYEEESNPMNKIYLPKSDLKRLRVDISAASEPAPVYTETTP